VEICNHGEIQEWIYVTIGFDYPLSGLLVGPWTAQGLSKLDDGHLITFGRDNMVGSTPSLFEGGTMMNVGERESTEMIDMTCGLTL
jgi:hypothetical protein